MVYLEGNFFTCYFVVILWNLFTELMEIIFPLCLIPKNPLIMGNNHWRLMFCKIPPCWDSSSWLLLLTISLWGSSWRRNNTRCHYLLIVCGGKYHFDNTMLKMHWSLFCCVDKSFTLTFSISLVSPITMVLTYH